VSAARDWCISDILFVGVAVALIGYVVSVGMRFRWQLEPVDVQGLRLVIKCSRATPKGVERFFFPTDAEVEEARAALPRYLKQLRFRSYYGVGPSNEAVNRLMQHRASEYIGFFRDGHPFLYGNYFPEGQPSSVCDGGGRYFDSVYDLDRHVVESVHSNGIA
jgi:hypothetical protein